MFFASPLHGESTNGMTSCTISYNSFIFFSNVCVICPSEITSRFFVLMLFFFMTVYPELQIFSIKQHSAGSDVQNVISISTFKLLRGCGPDNWKFGVVLFYLLHTKYQNLHSTRKMRTFLEIEDILTGLHTFKGLFYCLTAGVSGL